MSDLTFFEKQKLEKLFGMSSGYVMDFSNRTFQQFVAESIGKDIFASDYARASCSKANRLRCLWDDEPNFQVATLLSDLLDHWLSYSVDGPSYPPYVEGRRIAERLKQSAPVPDLNAITPNTNDPDFEILAKQVRDAIEKNAPETGLDRLHTFVTKYLRGLCEKHCVIFDKEKPLHSLMGGYIKHLKQHGLIESEMTERILKSSISILEAFNDVRNNKSFAHDNAVLNYGESLLIFNHVSSAIRFISEVERRCFNQQAPSTSRFVPADEDPFILS